MAPKKDAAKGGPGGAPTPEEVIVAYKAQNEALQAELERRTEKLQRADDAIVALNAKVVALGRLTAQADVSLADTHAEATRQYRGMQLRYEERIATLEAEADRLTRDADAQKARQLLSASESLGQLKAKDDVIARLLKRVDDITGEFGDMMAETVRRLASKIEVGVEPETGVGGEGGLAPQPLDVAAGTLKKLQEMTG